MNIFTDTGYYFFFLRKKFSWKKKHVLECQYILYNLVNIWELRARAPSSLSGLSCRQIWEFESSSLVKASDAISNPAALAGARETPVQLQSETSFLTDINSEIIQSTLKCRHLRTVRLDTRLRDTIESRGIIKRYPIPRQISRENNSVYIPSQYHRNLVLNKYRLLLLC